MGDIDENVLDEKQQKFRDRQRAFRNILVRRLKESRTGKVPIKLFRAQMALEGIHQVTFKRYLDALVDSGEFETSGGDIMTASEGRRSEEQAREEEDLTHWTSGRGLDDGGVAAARQSSLPPADESYDDQVNDEMREEIAAYDEAQESPGAIEEGGDGGMQGQTSSATAKPVKDVPGQQAASKAG